MCVYVLRLSLAQCVLMCCLPARVCADVPDMCVCADVLIQPYSVIRIRINAVSCNAKTQLAVVTKITYELHTKVVLLKSQCGGWGPCHVMCNVECAYIFLLKLVALPGERYIAAVKCP